MNDRRERLLLGLAVAFVVVQGAILTLSPAVRERSIAAPLRTSHWLGILVWLIIVLFIQHVLERYVPGRDLYLLPLWALLCGWGILTIWRLDPSFGLRQSAWLLISAGTAIWLVRHSDNLGALRRNKYLLLAAGLLLTALTIFLGTSPTGIGPRLWLGCCGIYLQPSEPLKLLLVLYLSAYLADHLELRTRVFPMLVPTIFIAGLALLLLLVQQDLGSASILILLYTIMLYVATERRRVLIVAASGLCLAAVAGFFFTGIIHARLESWLNPWNDPSGSSYQIIQSLLSVANGGIAGRGLGMGSPGLVPVSHSDFVYSAIAEESGLLGSLGLLTAYAIFFGRGVVIAVRASDRFQRLLAIGLTAYLGIQSLLIIGGDLRILPLTGVTLPFVSYGGSSLLTSCVAVAMLISTSSHPDRHPAPLPSPAPYNTVAGVIGLGIVLAALAQSWWAIIRGPDLLVRTDNARRAIADRYVRRGSLLDRHNAPISESIGKSGALQRTYRYPDLAPVVGYTHAIFGQAGIEGSMDTYLRGTQGNPVSLLIWDQLVYGTPPAGLDVRLSLDLELQAIADAALGDIAGAVVLLNAQSGEVLAMASHPTFDPNALDTIGGDLSRHQGRPLLNRATQGTYGFKDALQPFVEASRADTGGGGPAETFQKLKMDTAPSIRMPVGSPAGGTELRGSPLQLAMAAATLSADGIRPSPRIALAVDTPRQGWVVLPSLAEPQVVFSSQAARSTAQQYRVAGDILWQWGTTASSPDQALTWYMAGTLPDWRGTPLVVVALLERGDVAAAIRIGQSLLRAATYP